MGKRDLLRERQRMIAECRLIVTLCAVGDWIRAHEAARIAGIGTSCAAFALTRLSRYGPIIEVRKIEYRGSGRSREESSEYRIAKPTETKTWFEKWSGW